MFIHSVPSSLTLAEAIGMYRSELKKKHYILIFKKQINAGRGRARQAVEKI